MTIYQRYCYWRAARYKRARQFERAYYWRQFARNELTWFGKFGLFGLIKRRG